MSDASEGKERDPLVSIGLPVYNEARFLRATMDSLLAQSFQDFEMIISDNASEDATGEICRSYVSRDARIRYFRNEINRGPVENFNGVIERVRGKYFMLASGHDLWLPRFISRCVETLEADPSIVLCFPRLQYIDEEGRAFETGDTYLDTRGHSLVRRFNLALLQLGSGFMIYGLMRTEALRATRLCRRVWGPDRLLLIELAILGSFASVPETLFCARDNWGIRRMPRKERWRKHFQRLYPLDKPRLVWWFPEVHSTYEQLLAVRHARLRSSQRLSLTASVVLGYFLRLYRYVPISLRRRLRMLLGRLNIVPPPAGKGRVI